MWLREVMYAIKRDLIGLIGLIGRLSDKKVIAKNQGPNSNDNKVISPFETDRQILWHT